MNNKLYNIWIKTYLYHHFFHTPNNCRSTWSDTPADTGSSADQLPRHR